MTDEQYRDERTLSRELLRTYANANPRSSADWAPILAAYREARNPSVFERDFSCDPALYAALLDERAQLEATKSLKRWQGAPGTSRSKPLMDMTAALCLAQTGACEAALMDGWDELGADAPRRIEIWKSVFKDVPAFADSLQEEIERSRESRRDIEKRWESRGSTPGPADPKDVAVRTFEVSGRCAISDLDGNGTVKVAEEIPAELLGPANAFCRQYIPNTWFDRSDDGKSWIITQGSQDADAAEHLRSLANQLSRGWGENLRACSALAGNRKVHAGWDAGSIRVLGEEPALLDSPGATPKETRKRGMA